VPLVGPGPSWCRYQGGPWPEPHDTFVDFSTMPPGFEWLDRLGRRASDQVLADRGDRVVLGHGDWYAGNVVVDHDTLVGTFDWDLVADAEAVVVGFAAACYDSSSTSGGGLSTPEAADAFVRDYEEAAERRLTARERRAAAGATAWIIAFNARWQVALIEHGLCNEAVLALARDHGDEYLAAG
jgi:Ser/Thr protein kinase RdoA (MazF antagonist)